MHVFSLIGSLATGRTSDYIGRRYTIVLAAATFLIGALIMGFAPSFLFLMAGRVVAGIGFGFSLLIAPVYTSELSPAMARGFRSSLPEVFINIGILLGYISNLIQSVKSPSEHKLETNAWTCSVPSYSSCIRCYGDARVPSFARHERPI